MNGHFKPNATSNPFGCSISFSLWYLVRRVSKKMYFCKCQRLTYRKLDDFQQKPPRIPWKAIIFALVLFLVGSGLLIMALLISAGFMKDVKYDDRPISLMILGLLMFLPGAYHVRIAYFALRGHPSYSFDDIPEFQ